MTGLVYLRGGMATQGDVTRDCRWLLRRKSRAEREGHAAIGGLGCDKTSLVADAQDEDARGSRDHDL